MLSRRSEKPCEHCETRDRKAFESNESNESAHLLSNDGEVPDVERTRSSRVPEKMIECEERQYSAALGRMRTLRSERQL